MQTSFLILGAVPMCNIVDFGADISFGARTATVETIFGYLREHVPDHPEFRALLDQEATFEAIGGWLFGGLSPDAFRLLALLVDEMGRDLPAVAAKAGWVEEWKPTFYADAARFREKLAERIARLGTA